MQYSWTKPNKTCFMLKFSRFSSIRHLKAEFYDYEYWIFWYEYFWVFWGVFLDSIQHSRLLDLKCPWLSFLSNSCLFHIHVLLWWIFDKLAPNTFLLILLLACLISASTCMAMCSTSHLSCLWSSPMPPLTSWWSLTSCRLPIISAQWVAPAVSEVLCNRPVREPLDMPCICNDALLLKTFCHLGYMGVLLFINLKWFQLGIWGWPPSGLCV